jgi:hypothetical protein
MKYINVEVWQSSGSPGDFPSPATRMDYESPVMGQREASIAAVKTGCGRMWHCRRGRERIQYLIDKLSSHASPCG